MELAEEEVKTVERIASLVGLAFQVQDDILDVTSTQEELGKPIHSDEKNEKTTYVTLLGIDDAKKVVEEKSEEAISLLQTLPNEESISGRIAYGADSQEKIEGDHVCWNEYKRKMT